MKEFMGRDFLLGSATAEKLYYEYAEGMPIFDFHCHLNPQEIYEDKTYRSLTEVWLGGDHYKWRLMREFGIPERLITGDASNEEKFRAYASVMPYAVGNPIYAWTHLELRRFFGITDILSPATADKIYKEAGEKLKTLSARKMILNSNVKALCTTDDPADSLEYHIALKKEGTFPVRVLPAFRPDKVVDTTGAGDAFQAAMTLAYLENGGKIKEAVRYGAAAGAITVSRKGGAASSPTREEIAQFLKTH